MTKSTIANRLNNVVANSFWFTKPLSAYQCDASGIVAVSRPELVDMVRMYVEPLRQHFSSACSRIGLISSGPSYELDTSSFEAFARPLWGLAPVWAGSDDMVDYAKLYRQGIIAGTDPNHEEYWGTCRDNDQKFVEMAAIAYALMLAPEVLWEPLPERAKANVAAWLGQINSHEVWNNNWLFFPVLVNLSLRRLGRPWSPMVTERALAGIEDCYYGDGWYTDGPADGVNANTDYYNPFAYHFYGIIYAMFAREFDPARSARFSERAARFERDFRTWFSDRGESIAYGRSLTYRFAQSAFYSIAALAVTRGLDLDIDARMAKSIVVRNLKAWEQLPTTDGAGILQIGYHYPNLHMAEGYNAPGSPMWSFKAFALLAISADDAFWADGLMTLGLRDGVYASVGSTMLVQRAAGEATLYTGGRTKPRRFAHCEEKYCKFAYSSCWGFSVAISPYSLKEAAPDSMLAFEVDGLIRVRGASESVLVEAGELVSSWSPCAGIRVTTRIVPHDGMHERIHVIESDVDCVAYDCGFAVPAESLADAEGVCEVFCGNEGLCGETFSFRTEPNTNLMAPKTVIHSVRYEIPRGISTVVTLVRER